MKGTLICRNGHYYHSRHLYRNMGRDAFESNRRDFKILTPHQVDELELELGDWLPQPGEWVDEKDLKTSKRSINQMSERVASRATHDTYRPKKVGSSNGLNGLVDLLTEYLSQASETIDLDQIKDRSDVLSLFGQFLDLIYSFSNLESNQFKKIRPYLSRDPSQEESAWVKNVTDNRLVTVIKRALKKAWPEMVELFEQYKIDNRKWASTSDMEGQRAMSMIPNKISAVKIEDLPSNAFSGYYIEDTSEDSIFIDSHIYVGLGHPAFGGVHEETWTVSKELEDVSANTTKLNSIWEKHLDKIDKLVVERDEYSIYPSYDVSGFDYCASSQGGGYFTFYTTISVKVDELIEEDIKNIVSDLDDYISDLSTAARALSYDLNNEFKSLGVEFRSETGD